MLKPCMMSMCTDWKGKERTAPSWGASGLSRSLLEASAAAAAPQRLLNDQVLCWVPAAALIGQLAILHDQLVWQPPT